MFPYVASWEITKKCNLNCIHCFNDSSLFNEYGLSTEKCYKVIDRLDGIKNLIITGGEPLFRKDLKVIVDYARKKFDKLILQTNGELIPKMNNNLLHSFDEVDISIHGNPETDKKIKCGRTYFIESSLKILSKEDIPFTVATVLMNVNKTEMKDLIEFSKNVGANGVRIQDFVPYGRGGTELSINNLESQKIKRELKNKYKNYVTISSNNECGGGNVFIEINCKGNVSPCAFIKSNENIFEKNLYDIVNSELFELFRKRRDASKNLPKCQVLNI